MLRGWTSLLWTQAEGAGVVQPGEGKALGRLYKYTLKLPHTWLPHVSNICFLKNK